MNNIYGRNLEVFNKDGVASVRRLRDHGSTVSFGTRETREGWPLLTVETEVNGDLKSANERGPSLVGSLGLSRDFCSALAALVGLLQNIFILAGTLFQFFCAHRPASWAGSLDGSPLFVIMCLYSELSPIYLDT
jgi:hypothetical protein